MTDTQQVEQNAPAKKYELTDETTKSWDGRTLYRIRALVAIASIGVAAGDLGGFIEAEKNLEQSGNAWVSGDAEVFGDAEVYGNAWVYGNARVYGNAWVFGDARVSGNARVFGDAWVSGNASIQLSIHIGWHSHVGSENGTLTWFRTQGGEISVNRGCFSGTLPEFEKAVLDTHGGNQTAQEYGLLVQFIKLRASAWASKQTEAA